MPGAIAAGHPETVAAGVEILKQGGNAVDAAVAASFTSFVTESALVNIGGGGIAQVYDPGSRRATVYDFFSTMPGLSNSQNRGKLDFREASINFGEAQQSFFIGRGSVAVPGVVAGLCKMLEEQGSLPLPKILSPAIRIARQGAVLSKPQAYITHLLKPILLDTPEITALYAPEGQFVTAGDRLRFPELANTLEALGKEGVGLFYTGVVAQTILADQRAHGGLVTGRDLAAYRVRRTTPLSIHYRGYTILLPPPSSSGGPLIAFSLRLLGAIPLENVAHNGFDHLRTLAEVMRVTNVARARWEEVKHDDDGVQVFLGDEHVRQCGQKLQKAIDGHPQEPEPNLPKDPPNTTHISVADGNGMLVGITTSAGENAGFVVGNTGIMLNNMLGEIDLHPNGFHKTPPGQRFATMMSPAIVLKGSQPVLVVGSGGSSRLRTAILQVISNVLDFKLPLKEAVEAPRLHFEANVAQLEGGIDPGVADQLEDDLDRSSAGDTVNRWGKRTMFFGGTHTVARQGNTWAAAGDPRRGGATEIVD